MTAHSRVGASSMNRWAQDRCPGSVRLSKGLESKSSRAATEPSAAHLVGERALRGQVYRALCEVAHDGHHIEVTKEMIDHITEYKVVVDDLSDADTVRYVEHKFHLEQLHPALFGTSDCVLWHPKRQHLDVIDLKYGAGHAVEARDNVQLKYYALGAMLSLGYNPKTITLHIFQPRCPHPEGPHRYADIDGLDMLDFAGYLVASVQETEKPDAAIRAGDWCRWCPAAGVPGRCPAQAKAANELARVAFSPVVPYDPQELATWLDRLPILEAQIKAVREFAYSEAEAGRIPPRYKLVEKQATSKWRENVTPADLAKTLGVKAEDVTAPAKLIGITEAKKLAPGKNDKERAAVIASLTVKESSGHTLVHEDDKRPAVSLTAQAAFLRAK